MAPEDVLLVVTKERAYLDYFAVPRADLAVFVAATAGHALDLLFEKRPDVLLLDLEGCELPGLHLLHAARRLRRGIVTVVLSPNPSEDDAGILQEGVFYYSAKPPDPAALEVVLAAAQASARARAGRRRMESGLGKEVP